MYRQESGATLSPLGLCPTTTLRTPPRRSHAATAASRGSAHTARKEAAVTARGSFSSLAARCCAALADVIVPPSQ